MFLNLQRKKEEEKLKVIQFEFLCEETFFSDIQHFSEVPHYNRSIKKALPDGGTLRQIGVGAAPPEPRLSETPLPVGMTYILCFLLGIQIFFFLMRQNLGGKEKRLK